MMSCKRGNGDATFKGGQREELGTMFRVIGRLFPPTPCSTRHLHKHSRGLISNQARQPSTVGRLQVLQQGRHSPNGQNVRLGLSGPAREHPGKAGSEGLDLELLFGI